MSDQCEHEHDYDPQEEEVVAPNVGTSRAYTQCRHWCSACAVVWECVVGECLFMHQKLALCGSCYLATEVAN